MNDLFLLLWQSIEQGKGGGKVWAELKKGGKR